MLFLKWEEALENHILAKLGPLQKLIGMWEGKGFTIIARPDGKNQGASGDHDARIASSFHLQVNVTKEILLFIPILGKVINRGFQAQQDIHLHGLMYVQFIIDADDITNILHFETGQWLLVPATTAPKFEATIIRQATIFHGATFMAQGDAASFEIISDGPPKIPPEESTPPGIPLNTSYLKPYRKTPPPAGMPSDSIINPNSVLQVEAAILPSTTRTARITLIGSISPSSQAASTTTPPTSASATDSPTANTQTAQPVPSDVTNIPFLRKNAEVQNLTATFYVETVFDGNKEIRKQLQYTQKTFLRFEDINWPHIAVATLTHSPFPEDVGGLIAKIMGAAFQQQATASGSR
jgi:hypothetical protein